jgi:hypothetical protein
MAEGDLGDVGFLPSCPGLHPEDCGYYRLAPIPGRLSEQILRYLGVGLDVAVAEFLRIILAQRLRIDADHPGDVGLGHAVTCEGLDVPSAHRRRQVCGAAHGQASSGMLHEAPAV